MEEKLEEMSEKHQEQVSKANKDNSKLQQEAAHNKSRWWMVVWNFVWYLAFVKNKVDHNNVHMVLLYLAIIF